MESTGVIQQLQSAPLAGVDRSELFRGQLSLFVSPGALVQVVQTLRDTYGFNFLESICGVDYLGRDPRFEVVYHLISHQHRKRVCVKVGVADNNPHVPSITDLWVGANWHERETFDMFGIIFDGHPSLERILMPTDWVGYPLRKDVPLGGEEVAFTINEKKIYARKPFAEE